MNRSRTTIAGLLVLATLGHAAPAPAEERAQEEAQQCGQAFETAQQERLNGSYRAAREAARTCSDVQCPAAIINECVKLFEALQAEIPSVVLAARDRDGKELLDVQVDVDGVRVLDRIDGRPIEVDPGPHRFRFQGAPHPPVEITQTIRVGDQRRLVEAILGEQRPEPSPAVAPPPSAPPPPAAPGEKKSAIPPATYILGGVGILALGGFGFLRLSGAGDYDHLEETCSPRCDPDEVDSVRLKYQLSYAALGLGVAALGGAAVFYFANTGDSETANLGLKVATTPDGAAAQVLTRF